MVLGLLVEGFQEMTGKYMLGLSGNAPMKRAEVLTEVAYRNYRLSFCARLHLAWETKVSVLNLGLWHSSMGEELVTHPTVLLYGIHLFFIC